MSWYVMVYNPILKVMAPPFLWLQKVFYGPTVKVWFLEVFFSPRTLSSVPFLFFVPKKKTGQPPIYWIVYPHSKSRGLERSRYEKSKIWLKTWMVPGWYPDGFLGHKDVDSPKYLVFFFVGVWSIISKTQFILQASRHLLLRPPRPCLPRGRRKLLPFWSAPWAQPSDRYETDRCEPNVSAGSRIAPWDTRRC